MNRANHYTIYASVNRLLPRFRRVLEGRPEVRIVDVPTTDKRMSPEVGYYLEHLIKQAIDDEATHVATLHVDSFPIQRGGGRGSWPLSSASAHRWRAPSHVIIAHRLTTVRGCHTVYLLDRGQIIAQGTYDELMAESPQFRQMAKSAALAD